MQVLKKTPVVAWAQMALPAVDVNLCHDAQAQVKVAVAVAGESVRRPTMRAAAKVNTPALSIFRDA